MTNNGSTERMGPLLRWIPRPTRRIMIGAAATLAVALLVALGTLVYLVHDKDHNEAASQEALRTGVADVTDLLSYTPSTVLAGLSTRAGLLTGSFADEYTALVREKIAPSSQKDGVSAAATVVAAGIQNHGSDTATLLAFVNVTSSSKSKGSHTLGSRLLVTMRLVSGTWRVAEIKPI